jgi:hypothetical protein
MDREFTLARVKPHELYDEHFPSSGDELTVILKAHLISEELLRRIVRLYVPHSDYLEGARLSYSQWLLLARALAPNMANIWLWDALTELNGIRNQLAHNLSTAKAGQRIKALIRTVNQVSNSGHPVRQPVQSTLGASLSYLLGVLDGAERSFRLAEARGATHLLKRLKPPS